jgi:glucose-6-phosphate isomerase, archaeal
MRYPHLDFTQFDPLTGNVPGATVYERRLSDLRGLFADQTAYTAALAQDNALLYKVFSVIPDERADALFYAAGVIYPGRVGDEYYMTKGHYHAQRDEPEFYLGLRGAGMMVMENEQGESWTVPLVANSMVYVPGHTAHRTLNVGNAPMTYVAICPMAAGHDYESIVRQNFRLVVVAQAGQPVVVERAEFLATLSPSIMNGK